MEIFTFVTSINKTVNQFLWDNVCLCLLIVSGIFITVFLGFFQFRYFNLWCIGTLKSAFQKNKQSNPGNKQSISPFQSMCASMASTLGVGNIVGVASAIYTGGAGAVFWMWVAAVFGMITGYSENVLGIFYRRKNFNGQWCGGAMYYLRDGIVAKKTGGFLAWLFALFTLLSSFGIGSMGQVNKIVINIEKAFPIPVIGALELYNGVTLYSLLIGIFLFLVASVVVIGGIKRLAGVTEKLVPVMVIFFLVGSFTVIIKNYHNILPAFKAIFVSAFKPKAGCGGILGVSFAQGIKRGVFSNEAGMGSSVIIHAGSNVKEPCQQGMISMFEIFVDTIVICTVTALVVLTSGVYNLSDGQILASESTMVATAFNSVFSIAGAGQKFVAITIFLFAFSSVLGWNHYGAKAWEYIFGTRTVPVYKCMHLLSVIAGSIITSSASWEISDTFNALMIIPNMVGVILLIGTVKKITQNYIKRVVKRKNIPPLLSAFPDIEKSMRK